MQGKHKNIAYLLLGSNIGDSLYHLQTAAHAIEKNAGAIIKTSAYYKTAAWGNTRQADFINQALKIKTACTAEELMQYCLNIEKEMGRRRQEKYEPRIIDIDIIFYNSEIMDTELLTIPHPHMHSRRFVLMPLSEIAPAYVHPIFKKNINSLLKTTVDKSEVKKINA